MTYPISPSTDAPTLPRFFLHTFGGWRLEENGGPANGGTTRERLHTRKTASLVALLATAARPIRREELCFHLWPDAAPESARNSLSASLSALRRELGEDIVCADRHFVGLNAELWGCDWTAFERELTVACRDESDTGFEAARRALKLYSGPFLPELDEEPLLQKARHAEEGLCEALARHFALQLENGDPKTLAETLDEALRRFPSEWKWHFSLMRALERGGDVEASLRAYDRGQNAARKVGELTPEAAKTLARDLRRRLEERELEQKQALKTELFHRAARESIVENTTENAEVEPSARKEAVAEVAPPVETPEAPPVAALVSPLTGPILPPSWTKFLGREPEIAEVGALLRGGEKMVTLLGPGGTGKTRLALETARALCDEFEGRAFFVPLAPLFDPTLLPLTIRNALGLSGGSDLPPFEQIALALGDQKALFVLDNFEQLVEGGAMILQSLREAVPNAQMLVTSRVLLGLPGECEWEVPPLRQGEACALFLERAKGRWTAPEHAPTIQKICARLEDLPLAVELAAARASLLSPTQILERLDQKFDFLAQRGHGVETRHRTLRTAIEWSIDLLPPELRQFFVPLCVFRDGWTLEAACALTQVEEWQALDFLAQLREHSLISATEVGAGTRFRMLVLLREWAQEQLSFKELENLRTRHFAFFAQFIETNTTPQSIATRSAELLAETANFRAALTWALERTDAEATNDALRLCGALFPLWDSTSNYLDAREWMNRTQQKREWQQQANAGKMVEQSEVDSHTDARFGASFGFTLWYCAEFERARQLLEDSIAIAHAAGDDDTECFALSGLSRVLLTQGHFQKATEMGERGLEIARRSNDPVRLLNGLIATGWCYHNTARHAQTRELFDETYQIACAIGSKRIMALARCLRGLSYALEHQYEAAAMEVPEALHLAYEDGAEWFKALSNALCGHVAFATGKLDLARSCSPYAARTFARIGSRRETTYSLVDCGTLAVTVGEPERAARLFGAADELRDRIQHALLPSVSVTYAPALELLRTQLEPEHLEREWASGRALSLEEALQETDALALPFPAEWPPQKL